MKVLMTEYNAKFESHRNQQQTQGKCEEFSNISIYSRLQLKRIVLKT